MLGVDLLEVRLRKKFFTEIYRECSWVGTKNLVCLTEEST